MIPKENYVGFRTDLEDYFKWVTGVPGNKKAFTPFVFQRGKRMFACWNWRALFDNVKDDETIIMNVWPGHFRCDCFIFTLKDLQDYIQTNKIKL